MDDGPSKPPSSVLVDFFYAFLKRRAASCQSAQHTATGVMQKRNNFAILSPIVFFSFSFFFLD